MEKQEEEKKEKCTRKLDFSAPLLSTRKSSEKSFSCSNIPPQLSIDIFNRVPFSWEQRPGKPKEIMGLTTNIEIVPPPKLPPCMWHTRKELLATSSTTKSYDEVYDGDIDNDCEDHDVRNIDNHDVFSDALDVFSLGDESIDDMVDEAEHRKSNNEVVEECCHWSTNKPAVPNFIIQRFLKDAKELAISSALENNRKKLLEDEQIGRRPCNFSPKPAASCGLDMLIPWRIKPKPCCVKNSVVAASPRMRTQWSNRDKHASDADPKF